MGRAISARGCAILTWDCAILAWDRAILSKTVTYTRKPHDIYAFALDVMWFNF